MVMVVMLLLLKDFVSLLYKERAGGVVTRGLLPFVVVIVNDVVVVEYLVIAGGRCGDVRVAQLAWNQRRNGVFGGSN